MDAESERKEFTPLVGTETATIDEKGRVLLSKKKAERLGKDFALAIGNLGCLVAYPKWSWLKLCNEILSQPVINQGRDALTRLVLTEAVDDLNCDAQGRFVIPLKMRTKAKLSGELMLIGLGDRIEIWAKDEWEEFEKYPDAYQEGRRKAFTSAYSLMTSAVGG